MTTRREKAELLERVATAYRAAVKVTREPNVMVAGQLGLSNIQVGQLVYDARGRGLIPPTTGGRATGELVGLDCSLCTAALVGPYYELREFDGDGRQMGETLLVCGTHCLRKVRPT